MQHFLRFILILVLLTGGTLTYAQSPATQPASTASNSLDTIPPTATSDSPNLGQRLGDIKVRQSGNQYLLEVETSAGTKHYTPDQFAATLYQQQNEQPWIFSLLNITTWFGIAWVALGFLGQILFTGRMIVQWLVSEKEKRPIVPVAFWWMSITGASMLLIYFVWRQDIVGVIGQATGWFIYVRNLRFIYSSKYGGKDRINQPSTGDDATD